MGRGGFVAGSGCGGPGFGGVCATCTSGRCALGCGSGRSSSPRGVVFRCRTAESAGHDRVWSPITSRRASVWAVTARNAATSMDRPAATATANISRPQSTSTSADYSSTPPPHDPRTSRKNPINQIDCSTGYSRFCHDGIRPAGDPRSGVVLTGSPAVVVNWHAAACRWRHGLEVPLPSPHARYRAKPARCKAKRAGAPRGYIFPAGNANAIALGRASCPGDGGDCHRCCYMGAGTRVR